MQFVSAGELRNRSAAIWKTLSEKKDLVATSNGKPIALLSATSDETLEEPLGAIRRARAQSAVAATQQALLRAGTDRLCMEEINAEVRAARRERGK